ncbi:hypothetical protein Tsp_00119 [Trichinella spiralis]|uniref:hypothetical protein n=1 Tax=Trichinella spiralis TaxID=6334 RepID=UPI0001EFC028|nr:hypothetical protein Tsp_00119 [Trichinella spiralis]
MQFSIISSVPKTTETHYLKRSARLAESKNQQLPLQSENDTDSSEELHIANKVDIYINPSAFRKEKPSDRFIPVPLKKIFSTIESHQLASSQNLEGPTTSKMCSAQLEKPNIECLLRDKHIKLTKESTEIYRMQDDIFNSIYFMLFILNIPTYNKLLLLNCATLNNAREDVLNHSKTVHEIFKADDH